MKRAAPVLYALLALAVAYWLVQGWNSDRRRIGRQLDELRELVEKTGPENDLAAANKARQVGDLLARDFELHLEPYGPVVTDRQRLMQVTLGYRRRAERIGLDFHDREFTVDPRLRVADLTTTATLTGRTAGSAYRELYRLRLGWVEEEGEWRIRRVELLEVLDGSASFL